MDELLKNYPSVLTISDVAQIFNVTPATIRKHIKNSNLPHIKIGKLTRIPKGALITYLERGISA